MFRYNQTQFKTVEVPSQIPHMVYRGLAHPSYELNE